MAALVTLVVSLGFNLLFCLQGVEGWPEGTYGLPMATSGCPASQEFEWEEGSRTQNTEDDSYASDPIHLAGITPQKSDSIVQNFCMKTSYTQEGEYYFTKGRYCIFKRGDCPAGFKEGFIYWDDDSAFLWNDDIQHFSGVLPDGEFDSNTKIFYCCRRDGPVSNALTLPTEAPFFLFRVQDEAECMHVKGMEASQEWVYWSDEATLNMNGRDGLHPHLERSRYPWRYTKLYYCYYTKKGVNTNVQTAMTVIYALAGAVGLIFFILFIVCIVQKICTYKDAEMDSPVTEHMLHTPTAITEVEPSVIYRPSNGYAKVQDEVKPSCPEYIDEANGAAAVPSAPPFQEENRRITQPPTYEQVMQEIETTKS